MQQQVYLLELETRYLKSPGGDKNDHQSQPQQNDSSSAPLNDTLKNLKQKFVELQESHKKEIKKIEESHGQLKTEFALQSVVLQNTEKERQELSDSIASIKEHHTNEKDKLYGEALTLRKKLQTSQGDLSRLELQYQRVNAERNKFQTENSNINEELKRSTYTIEEQLTINNTLKNRVDELRKQNAELSSSMDDIHASYATFDLDKNKNRITELEQEVKELKSLVQIAETRRSQEEHLRMRSMEDCSELVRSNVSIKTELEDVQRRLRKEFEQREEKLRHKQDRIKEVESAREELSRIKDELSMNKISIDTKETKIVELLQRNKSVESALTKSLDTQRILEDRIIDLENRLRNGENEAIQLGQDKSLLIDDVAELRNISEINGFKVSSLLKEKQELQVELAKFQREMKARKEFSSMISELEHSGENYLGLMRNIKCFMGEGEVLQ